MSDDRISIERQAAAVELAAVNHRGHVENLRDLVARGKRPETDLEMAASYLPALTAAAKTMRWFANNEDRIKSEIITAPRER